MPSPVRRNPVLRPAHRDKKNPRTTAGEGSEVLSGDQALVGVKVSANPFMQ